MTPSKQALWALFLLALNGRSSRAQDVVARSQNVYYCMGGYSELCNRSLLTARERLMADSALATRDRYACRLVLSRACLLDANGKFASREEQDMFIAATLKYMARELNSQTPLQLDEETRLMSVIALQNTITFSARLPNYTSSQVDSTALASVARENLNHIVCRDRATRDLIDWGVRYVYLYSGNDGKLIVRVTIDRYQC